VGRSLVYWQVWPVALWFLWPQRLYFFGWFSNPSSNPGEFPQYDLWGGYAYYWSCLSQDYHVGLWSLLAVLALAAVAFAAGPFRGLRPGGAAILWLAVFACVLCAHHPNRKSRFLHSWIAVVWVEAGVGAACLLRYPLGGSRRGRAVRLGFAGCFGSLVALHLPALVHSAHAPEGGICPSSVSVLEVTDAYLPYLRESRQAAVFCSMPMKFLAQWTYMRRYGRPQRLETDIKGFDPRNPMDRHGFEQWLAATKCDTVVSLDLSPRSKLNAPIPGSAAPEAYGEMLASQRVFTAADRRVLPAHGCTVTIWKRPAPSESSAAWLRCGSSAGVADDSPTRNPDQ
jgi:hypothetical protein